MITRRFVFGALFSFSLATLPIAAENASNSTTAIDDGLNLRFANGIAAITPEPGTTLTHADLRAWCKERLTGYKVPRDFYLIDEQAQLLRQVRRYAEEHLTRWRNRAARRLANIAV